MPSKKPRLSDADIARIAKWIARALPTRSHCSQSEAGPRPEHPSRKPTGSSGPFQPLKAQEPPAVKTHGWARTPADQFILARLEAQKIKPMNHSDRRRLIRRA